MRRAWRDLDVNVLGTTSDFRSFVVGAVTRDDFFGRSSFSLASRKLMRSLHSFLVDLFSYR